MSLVIFCLLVCFVDYVPLIGDIIWYLSLTTWLISFSIMLSSSIHAVTKWRSSFFLLRSIPLCKCTIVFFFHSFTDGHLGCFQYLAVVNCAAMKHSLERDICTGGGSPGGNPCRGSLGVLHQILLWNSWHLRSHFAWN